MGAKTREMASFSIMNCIYVVFMMSLLVNLCCSGPEENEGVKYANKCEVCKVVAHELENRLEETGKVHDVIETGYSLDDIKPKKKTQYKKSELRLVESLENICNRILEYNIHKEREDSTRFAKGMSQTFKTLHGLVDKGVKVDLGIPVELWDKPSVEITNMKTQCELMLEHHESDIEDWYWKHQGTVPLQQFLCRERVLKNTDTECLSESLDRLKGEKGSWPSKKEEQSKSAEKQDEEQHRDEL